MGYMGAVLNNIPEQQFAPPAGVLAVPINPETGLRVADGQSGVTDYFYQEFLPPEDGVASAGFGGGRPPEDVRNQLF